MKTFPVFILLLAASLATPSPAQYEFASQTNLSMLKKTGPSVSKDGKVAFSLAAPKATDEIASVSVCP